MHKRIRYGDFLNTASVWQRRVSFNQLTPKPSTDSATGKASPLPQTLKLDWSARWRLLRHYIDSRLQEQLKAVLPIATGLVLFQWFFLQAEIDGFSAIVLGLAAVIIGLMLFMEGLKRGLMPFGEHIGDALPRKAALWKVLSVVFLLGVGVTFAEPAIGILKAAGSIVQADNAPLLHALLNQWSETLVLVVGAGVGLAAVLASLRLVRNWSLKPLIYFTLIPLLGLSMYFASHDSLRHILGLAWDCGAVTTGPVTVPLVLALGVGVAGATSKSTEPSGFGIVTLASLFPVFGVLLLGGYVFLNGDVQEITPLALNTPSPWHEQSPWQEILLGLRAIVPLIVFLYFVLRWLLHDTLARPRIIIYGLILTIFGMIVFNLGLNSGLAELGRQAGSNVPAIFQNTDERLALYPGILGYAVALLFAWGLGFGATLAEPALHAMGMTVENLTQGAFRKKFLIYAVSVGVAFGITLGVIKLIGNFSLMWILLPGYSVALIMTYFSSEEFVNIAWDSAGVTTGPVTVPLVLAMGLGFGGAVEALEGFGILAAASVGPIITVLATGLWIEWQIRRSHCDAPARPTVASAHLQI
jgi:hypothetical protein